MDPITPDYVFNFYRNIYVPAYADVVGYIGDKPEQTMIELENTLAHISQFYNPDLQIKDKEENLKKAYSHLTRATLDCYKMLWLEINEEIDKFNDDADSRAFILNVPEEKFIHEYQEFKNKAQNARKKELESIGVDPLESVELYKEAIVLGKNLITYIDGRNQQKFNKFRQITKMKEYVIGFIIGIAAGLLANYIWSLYIKP